MCLSLQVSLTMQEIIKSVNTSDPDLFSGHPDITKQTSAIYRFIAKNEDKWPFWFLGSDKMPIQYKKRLDHPKARLSVFSTLSLNNLRYPSIVRNKLFDLNWLLQESQ